MIDKINHSTVIKPTNSVLFILPKEPENNKKKEYP